MASQDASSVSLTSSCVRSICTPYGFEKLERTLLVAVGIDHDADEVVVESSVAVTQVGADRERLRVRGAEPYI